MKKKILFVIAGFGSGGAERVLSILLQYLDRNKIQPVCIVFDDSHRAYAIPDDVMIYSLKLPGIDNALKKIVYALRRIFKIKEIINREKPDLIFSFVSKVNLVAIVAWLLSKRLEHNAKLIVSVRGYLSLALKGKYFHLIKYFIRILYPKANKIIVNAEAMKKDLIENFNLPAEKIYVVHNPLDIRKIEELAKEPVEHAWFNDEVPVIINVGSLVEAKAQENLLKSFKLVREKVVCRLVILGKGKKESNLKRLSLDLGISDDVAFLGFQNNPFKFVSKSSVFVLSSRWEGFPNALLEAMACGVPVISTRCPSGPEEIITDSVNGLLVPVENEGKLAEAILKVLINPALAVSMALEGKKTVSRFDVKTTIANYERLFIP